MNTFLPQSSDWGHMNGWGGGGMWLWGVVAMTLCVVLIVWLLRALRGSTGAGQPNAVEPNEQARGILAERFAKGELSPEEYQERLDALR